MTAPAKPPIDEQILQNQLAEADRRAAGRPKPVNRIRVVNITENGNKTEIIEHVLATDYDALLAYADRVAAERDDALKAVDDNWVTHQRVVAAERQLAELQAKHEGLVRRLREPVEEYLNINDLWKKSEDDAEGMDLGYTTQAHYFAALLQQAMSAVALDKGGE